MKVNINYEEVSVWDAFEDHIYQLLVDLNMTHLHILHFFKTVWMYCTEGFRLTVIKK